MARGAGVSPPSLVPAGVLATALSIFKAASQVGEHASLAARGLLPTTNAAATAPQAAIHPCIQQNSPTFTNADCTAKRMGSSTSSGSSLSCNMHRLHGSSASNLQDLCTMQLRLWQQEQQQYLCWRQLPRKTEQASNWSMPSPPMQMLKTTTGPRGTDHNCS